MTSAQEVLNQFKSLTGANDETSKFFLEASGWNLEVATSTFFDNGGVLPQSQAPQQSQSRPVDPTPARSPSVAPVPERKGGVVGFSDLRGDESKGQNYYTGGAKSGMVVQDPQKDEGGEDLVDRIVENAKKHAVAVNPEKEEFHGSGYRLGNLEGPGYKVKAGDTTSAQSRDVTKIVTFWKNGFTVDNGPLRTYDDPANKVFLDDIGKGVIPRELEHGVQGTKLHVDINNKKAEEYKPPPVVLTPFTGAGHVLSVPVSRSIPIQKSSTKPREVKLDESQPMTTVQIRLHNGQRLVQKFNHAHTVGDIRAVIDAKGPFPNYRLQTPFPVQILGEDQQTIKDANLLNAVIVQQLI